MILRDLTYLRGGVDAEAEAWQEAREVAHAWPREVVLGHAGLPVARAVAQHARHLKEHDGPRVVLAVDQRLHLYACSAHCCR